MVVFVLGIPFVTFVCLRKAKKADLNSKQSLARFVLKKCSYLFVLYSIQLYELSITIYVPFRYGFLYTRFQEKLYMWELVVMLRSVSFVMCLTFVDS